MSERLPEIIKANVSLSADTVENNSVEVVENLKKEVRVLFEPGAVNFYNVTENLNLDEINSGLLEKIRGAVSGKIYEIMISGHFNDLRGSKELMEKLGIEGVSLLNEDLDSLNKYLERLSVNCLVRLGVSQPPEMGKYDLEKAKEILIGAGYSEDELSDDEIKKIMNFKHILLALKDKKIDKIDKIKSLPNLLE